MSTKMNINPYETYKSPKGLAYRVTGVEKVEGSVFIFVDIDFKI